MKVTYFFATIFSLFILEVSAMNQEKISHEKAQEMREAYLVEQRTTKRRRITETPQKEFHLKITQEDLNRMAWWLADK